LKHVFVETNFLVDVLRPSAGQDGTSLLERHGKDVTLYVPWVSVVEAKRTLDRIVKEDLGFHEKMLAHAVRRLRDKTLSKADHKVLDTFAKEAAQYQYEQVSTIEARVDEIAKKVELIEPDKAVVEKTLSLFPVKSLPPFDEMVLGAVLVKAAALKASGGTDIIFCNLNKNDFDPAKRPNLAAEYAACGITYRSDFKVP